MARQLAQVERESALGRVSLVWVLGGFGFGPGCGLGLGGVGYVGLVGVRQGAVLDGVYVCDVVLVPCTYGGE